MTSETPPRNALVTGAARRIGRAIAEDLASHGWGVAIHCNASRIEAEDLAHRIVAAGGRATTIVADLTAADGLPGIVAAAEAALGPVDLLVNNAAIFEADAVGSLDPALFERHMRINVAAPCLLAEAVAARLPPGLHGNIVNIVDQRVLKPTPQFFSYTLAKAALHMATTTLAQALAPRLRVNAVGPGPTVANRRQSAADFARQAAAVPLGHGPDLSEFGRTIRFLVDSPSITGQMICLDGGQRIVWRTPDVVGVGED